jgi:biopolymer transport protein ExbB/TolQ
MEQLIGSAINTTHILVPLSFLVLVVFSFVSVAVMIERAMTLKRIRRIEDADYKSLKEMLVRGQHDAVRATVAASQAPSAMTLQAGFDLQDINPDLAHEAITQEIEVQCAELQGQLPLLATIASTAPYIGLFGTVLGILNAFHVIAQTGQTGASQVAAPIAEALFATAMGLGVAIPAVMGYNYFSGRINDLSLRVETHALDMAARLPGMKTKTEGEN